ncbi:hypothetical protein TURU_036205 [Turdus rufiventris]|nr:hypothetical protein TURU_036205 [Turdus rufiventris]
MELLLQVSLPSAVPEEFLSQQHKGYNESAQGLRLTSNMENQSQPDFSPQPWTTSPPGSAGTFWRVLKQTLKHSRIQGDVVADLMSSSLEERAGHENKN